MNDIETAVKILKKGGIVVCPTDTAYGLAVDATNEKAVKRLFKLKGRNFKKPVHVTTPNSWLKKLVRLDSQSLRLIKKFWPGPLTIILPLKVKGKSWQILSAGMGTLGVRYPNHATAQALVEALNRPVTTTSANLSGNPPCFSIPEIKKEFAKSKIKPDFYLDGGRLRKVKPSTVVRIDKNRVTILRQGPISETQIKRALK